MWFKRRSPKRHTPPVGPDPVNTINLMGRLDSVIDRLEGVSEQLISGLEQAQEQRDRNGRRA